MATAKKVLLIGEKQLKENSVIETNVDSKVLSVCVANVQELQLKPILGKPLYDKVIDTVYSASTDSGYTINDLTTELLGYIRPYLTYAVLVDFIVTNNYKITNKGTLKLNDSSASNLNTDELDFAKQYYDNKQNAYKLELISFLNANKLTGCDTDKDVTSTSGWFLGIPYNYSKTEYISEAANNEIGGTGGNVIVPTLSYANGLSLIDNSTVVLGGTLTGDTTLNLDNNQLYIGSFSGPNSLLALTPTFTQIGVNGINTGINVFSIADGYIEGVVSSIAAFRIKEKNVQFLNSDVDNTPYFVSSVSGLTATTLSNSDSTKFLQADSDGTITNVSIPNSSVSVNNGLTSIDGNIILGGDLTGSTNININGSDSFTINGSFSPSKAFLVAYNESFIPAQVAFGAADSGGSLNYIVINSAGAMEMVFNGLQAMSMGLGNMMLSGVKNDIPTDYFSVAPDRISVLALTAATSNMFVSADTYGQLSSAPITLSNLGAGVLSTDLNVNNKAFIQASTGNLTIGATGGTAPINVISDSFANIQGDTYSVLPTSSSQFSLRRGRGTSAAPTAVLSDDRLGAYTFQGYDGAAFNGFVASIAAQAAENYSGGTYGSYFTFSTTNVGATSRSEKLRITSEGLFGLNTGVNTTAKLHINGNVTGAFGVSGNYFKTNNATIFDTTTSAQTLASVYGSIVGNVTFNATNAITATELVNFTIGLPVAAGALTATTSYSLKLLGGMKFAASTTARSVFTAPTGATPTNPIQGDVWHSSNGLKMFTTSTKRVALSNDVTPTNGQLLIGDGTGFTVATLTGTQGITPSVAAGSLAIGLGTNVTIGHIIGATSTPTIVSGTGSNGVVSLSGTDLSGNITVTTTGSPTSGATVCTITFNTTYSSIPKCVMITPANAITAALNGASMAYVNQTGISTSTFAITAGSTPLSTGTAYKWYYMVIQ